MVDRSRLLGTATILALLAGNARAEDRWHVQGSFALGMGLAVLDKPGDVAAGFAMAMRPEVMLPLRRDGGFEVGPYGEVFTTDTFDGIALGGGASFLIPVGDNFPLVLSSGVHGDVRNFDSWGVTASAFLGFRLHKTSAPVDIPTGGRFDARWGLADDDVPFTVVFSFQIDLVALIILAAR